MGKGQRNKMLCRSNENLYIHLKVTSFKVEEIKKKNKTVQLVWK